MLVSFKNNVQLLLVGTNYFLKHQPRNCLILKPCLLNSSILHLVNGQFCHDILSGSHGIKLLTQNLLTFIHISLDSSANTSIIGLPSVIVNN